MNKVLLTFNVNGEEREVAFSPHKTLLEVLREELGLHALPRLVSVEELVPEGLDDGVEGGADVRDLGMAEERRERAQEPDGGAHLLPPRGGA